MSDTKRTDTPRTDAQSGSSPVVATHFARQLERELSAEREKVRELREALSKVAYKYDIYGSMEEARATLEKTK